MTVDRSFPFHLLHREDHQPIRYERICSRDGTVVPWEETVKGYEFRKGHFVEIERDEIAAAMPESDRKIHIEKFVHYLGLDPMYFSRSYLLAPGRDPEAYRLLTAAFEREGKAGVGRFTLRTREYPVVIHAYHGGLVLTTLRYADEVLLPSSFPEILAGTIPPKRDLDLAARIIADLTGDFAITDFHDRARDNIEQLIRKKMAGETFVVEKPQEAEHRALQEALAETLARLKSMQGGESSAPTP
jgi:DNA end-binding protein Ku